MKRPSVAEDIQYHVQIIVCTNCQHPVATPYKKELTFMEVIFSPDNCSETEQYIASPF